MNAPAPTDPAAPARTGPGWRRALPIAVSLAILALALHALAQQFSDHGYRQIRGAMHALSWSQLGLALLLGMASYACLIGFDAIGLRRANRRLPPGRVAITAFLAHAAGQTLGFAALTGEVPPFAWVLYVANIFWATGYDTWYAMVDRDDDLRMGAKSTAILFGDMDLVAQGVLYAGMFAALALVGRDAGMGTYYWAGLGVAVLLVGYEFAIARCREREWCFRAFLHNHWVGMAIFAGIAADYALRGTAVAA